LVVTPPRLEMPPANPLFLSMLSSIHDLLVQYLDMVEQIVREKRKC
jgi:hypothetical protein